jgi:ATP-dependent helicase/nuclease subunit A
MGVFFGRLYEELLLRERVATLPNGDQRVHNLEYLHRRAVQFDSFRRKGLAQFLGFLDDLMERGEDLGTPAAVAADADVVRIMTMHKSKGLQFPLVVLPFLAKRFNLADARAQVLWDARAGFGVGYLPGRRYGNSRLSVTREMLVDTIEDRSRSEEMRLLYVAMTRAKERLVLTGTMKKSGEKVEALLSGTALGHQETVARSQSFLAWVLLGLAGRAEMRDLPERGKATNKAGTWAVHLHPAPVAPAPTVNEQAERDVAARLDAVLSELRGTLERVARLERLTAPVAIRAKVSATEAKRAFEALHSPDNPPAAPRGRFRQRATEELPDWWPAALAPEQRTSGAHRGTLTHRLCALVDLEALAGGATVAQELERLVARGLFIPADAARIPVADVQRFFASPGLGARVLTARATARREVPFTIRLSPAELGEESVDDTGWIVFQGMVDLLFEEPDPETGGRRLVLVDFKTDHWDGTTTGMETLERAYTPQIGLYRLGIERALGRRVEEAWLHFLSGNVSLHVTEGGRPEDWRPWLAAACLLPAADGANADPQGRR